ncbi:uncharacterized protein DS421_10g289480 [Arachis hypogaea]|nr:uncharacterized protein DS421_10g289480 [Arachis hypogaea]
MLLSALHRWAPSAANPFRLHAPYCFITPSLPCTRHPFPNSHAPPSQRYRCKYAWLSFCWFQLF